MPDHDTPTTAASSRELATLTEAFDLARLGPAHGPNPRVGCVLLADDGVVLATGFHRGAGTPHAEVDALANARAAGHDTRGATAVVTLEPCNHTGRTGPCSQALLDAGVRRVVFAVADPNPSAAGGAAHLRAAGVETVGPRARATDVTPVPAPTVEQASTGDHASMVKHASTGTDAEAEGRALLRAWLTSVERGRPFVTLKTATSLDGRIAAADGSSRWITSEHSRTHAHALRAEVDAILVGTGTALTDDPSLTARTPDGSLASHQPVRVVVGHRDIPADAAVRGPGGELVHLRTHDVTEALAALQAREIRHVLVEGGPTLAAEFLRAGVVDELHAYIAPVLLGAGKSAVGDLGVTTIGDALRWDTREVHRLGPDVLVVAVPTGDLDPDPDPETTVTPDTTKEP